MGEIEFDNGDGPCEIVAKINAALRQSGLEIVESDREGRDDRAFYRLARRPAPQEKKESANPFVVLDRWLAWLDSHDGRLYRRGRGGDETDGDLVALIPNPPVQAIFTVGDLRAVVETLRDVASPADGECRLCGGPTDSLAGDPGRWPLIFPDRDGAGVVRFWHVSCVMAAMGAAGGG